MQKQNPVDDLFRRGLAEYRVTPSEERREATVRDAAQETGKGSSKRWWIMGLGAGLLITAGIGLLVSREGTLEKQDEVHIKANNENRVKASNENRDVRIDGKLKIGNTDNNTLIVKKVKEVKAGTVVVKENAVNTNGNTRANASLNASRSSENRNHHGTLASKVEPAGQPKGPVISPRVSLATVPQTGNEDGRVKVNNEGQVAGAIAEPRSEKQNAEPNVKPAVKEVMVGEKADETQGEPEQSVKTGSRKEEKVPGIRKKNSLPKNWNINAGIYYSPEWMFNTLNGDKFANNMGVEGTFHFGPYSVRTGVGLSITTGSNEKLVQTNSYLGSYPVVDSVVFNWDKTYSNLIPTVYTTSTNIYDTALSYNYSSLKKRYTYLQVPLVLGYDFWQNRWLSLGVRAGTVMSVLLKSENISATYDAGKDRIISINDISPGRIQLNWQAMGGFNASFRLSHRFSIELEPDVRYYFNSVYESSEITKKPWSVGVRSAFLITF